MEPTVPPVPPWNIIDNLPLELQFIILEILTRAQKTLVSMTCWKWYNLIKAFSPGLRTDPNLLLWHAAKHDYQNLLIYAKRTGVDDFKGGMKIAAINGHLEIMKTLYEWGKIKPQKLKSPPHLLIQTALVWSSYGGNLEGIKLAKSWGTHSYILAIEKAAEGGHPACMKLAREYVSSFVPKFMIRRSISKSLTLAASNGHLECMKLAKHLGARNYQLAMTAAARKGRIEAVKLLKVWGTLRFKYTIFSLTKEIDILRKQIDRNVKNDPYRQYKSGSYVKLKIKGTSRKRLIKIPTISQRIATRSYFQTELEKLIECLTLLKSWEKEKMEI